MLRLLFEDTEENRNLVLREIPVKFLTSNSGKTVLQVYRSRLNRKYYSKNIKKDLYLQVLNYTGNARLPNGSHFHNITLNENFHGYGANLLTLDNLKKLRTPISKYWEEMLLCKMLPGCDCYAICDINSKISHYYQEQGFTFVT